MLLALWPDMFADSLCKKKKNPTAWMSYANEPRATSIWKKCSDSGTKSDKLEKSVTSGKKAPKLTHTIWIRGTSQTSASLSQKGSGTSVTYP